MSKRRQLPAAERHRYVAGLLIAGAAFVGLGAEIAWMVTAGPF